MLHHNWPSSVSALTKEDAADISRVIRARLKARATLPSRRDVGAQRLIWGLECLAGRTMATSSASAASSIGTPHLDAGHRIVGITVREPRRRIRVPRAVRQSQCAEPCSFVAKPRTVFSAGGRGEQQ